MSDLPGATGPPIDRQASDHARVGEPHAEDVVREAATMALYVAVCLLAALIALPKVSSPGHVGALELIWGTTIGLALAHLFAFRMAARLVAQGAVRRHDTIIGLSQLAGAAIIGTIATIPVVLMPEEYELDAIRLVLAGAIGGLGFVVSRRSGGSTMRSLVTGVVVLVLAATIAAFKNLLSGH